MSDPSSSQVHVSVPLGSEQKKKPYSRLECLKRRRGLVDKNNTETEGLDYNPEVNNDEIEVIKRALRVEKGGPGSGRRPGVGSAKEVMGMDQHDHDNAMREHNDYASRAEDKGHSSKISEYHQKAADMHEHLRNANRLKQNGAKEESPEIKAHVSAASKLYSELKNHEGAPKVKKSDVKKSAFQRAIEWVRKANSEPRRVSTVAVTHGDNLLMGKRRDNGKWTMPGGHVDPGEDFHQGGVRELKEESGLDAKELFPLTDVVKMIGGDGQPLHVQAWHHQLEGDKPPTSMQDDPDGEVERWRWVDVSDGLPDEIKSNLHVPLGRNIALHALGLGEDETSNQYEDLYKNEDPATADDTEDENDEFESFNGGNPGDNSTEVDDDDLDMALYAITTDKSAGVKKGGGNSGPKVPNHLDHMGQKVHSSGHTRGEAYQKAADLRNRGVFASVVRDDKEPAGKRHAVLVPKDYVKKSTYENLVPIAKADKAKQIIYCVVTAPDEWDSQDDTMTADEIEKTAHQYLIDSRVVGSEHSKAIKACVVESFIAPIDFEWPGSTDYAPQKVKKGSWVIGIKVNDPAEWKKVEDGDYEGVSVGGFGLRDKVA